MSVNKEVVIAKNWILNQINEGHYVKGEPIASQYEISRILDINRDDIELAFHELVTEQILTESFEEGFYLKQCPQFSYPINELKSITAMIIDGGAEPGTIIISQDIEMPSIDDCRVLKISNDKEITVLERLRTADDEPVVYCLDKIETNQLPDISRINKTSLLETMAVDPRLVVEYAVSEIESIGYEPYISGALGCMPDESLLLFKQVHYNHNDEPILYSLNYFRSSKVRLEVQRAIKQ